MEALLQDLRYGLRILARNPTFTIVAVLALALGIGVNAALFSVVEATLFPPLAVAQPGSLASIYTIGFHGGEYRSTSYPDYIYYRDRARAFSGIAAYSRIRLRWTQSDHTEFPWAEIVSDNYFAVLGVKPFMGQTILPEGNPMSGGNLVAVVSYPFWQRRLASDPNVVGKTLTLNGTIVTIVGVSPPDFEGVDIAWGDVPQLWVPLAAQAQIITAGGDLLHNQDVGWLLLVARLRSGVRFREAGTEVKVLARQLAQEYGGTHTDNAAVLLPLHQARFWPGWRDSILHVFWLLAVSAGSVLLIACANVASLQLARANTRRQEIGIRMAVGASRAGLIRQLLTESALLSFLGTGLGLVLVLGIVKLMPIVRLPFQNQMALHLHLDLQVLGFTLLLSLFTTFTFGLVPAITAARSKLSEFITGGAQHFSSLPGFTLHNLIVIGEVMLAFLCLIGAGLSFRSLRRIESNDFGFHPDNVLAVTMNLKTGGYSEETGTRFYVQLLDGVSRLSGVRSACLTSFPPLSLLRREEAVIIEGQEEEHGDLRSDRIIEVDSVSPGYFQTLQIPILRGRDFTNEDTAVASGVAIINRTMAEHLWPRQVPIGKRIQVRGESAYRQIVGVVDATKSHTLWQEPGPYLYLPMTQSYSTELTLLVRTIGDPMSFLHEIQRQVAMLDKEVPTYNIEPLEHQVKRSLAQPRMIADSLLVFAAVALLLAAGGIYGVISYWVSRRTREIGIRMALGASPRDVLKRVTRQGMVLVLTGVAVGMATAIVLMRFLSSLLYGVRPTDPVTFSLASFALVVIALVVTYIPARRAAKTDPAVVLRLE